MRTIACGVDLVLCSRIERVWQQHGAAFLQRVYTHAEASYCQDCKTPVQRLAGRWAAKEAVLKALGTGWRGGILWTDIETLPDGFGRPLTRVTGRTAELSHRAGVEQYLVSISHAGEYACAMAVALGP